MKRNVIHLMMLLVLALVPLAVQGQPNQAPPGQFSYQGFLTDANGIALATNAPRNYTVIFRIYGVSSGGTPKWSELQTVTVDRGYFTAMLGAGSAYNTEPNTNNLTSLFNGADASDRYLGLTAQINGAGDPEILPRLRLLPTPYSFLAANAVSVTGTNSIPAYSLSTNIGAWTATSTNVYRANGTVGIGTSAPAFPLSFANLLGDKISLWGTSGNSFGLGVQASLLQLHTDTSGSDIAFGYGSSAAFNENMRIQGNGNVGIGMGGIAALYRLQANGAIAVRDTTVTDGFTTMQPGSSANAGYFEWWKPGPTRLGYMGYSSGGINNLGLNMDSGANFNINGGSVGIGLGSANPAYTLDVAGNIHTTGYMGINSPALSGNGLYIKGGSTCGIEIQTGSYYGLFIDGATTYGAYIIGNVYVAGTLSKSAGTFKIDHPLDPEKKWLLHSFVESPDMMNVYNGNHYHPAITC